MNDQSYLEHILKGIVLRPEHMRLMRSEDDRGILFRIHLAKSDMPLVIGKAGQSIHAIRLLMKLYAKDGPRISLVLEEPTAACDCLTRPQIGMPGHFPNCSFSK